MDADTVLSAQDLRVLWRQLADDDNLVERYELTEHGEIVMSPRPTNRHQIVATLIANQLKEQLGGLAVTEIAVVTASAGIRVPDVVWMPSERWTAAATDDVVEAPDVVVEVLSPGNRKAEMAHKVQAYLASGVGEVIVVGTAGTIAFHRADGEHRESALGLALQLPPELFA